MEQRVFISLNILRVTNQETLHARKILHACSGRKHEQQIISSPTQKYHLLCMSLLSVISKSFSYTSHKQRREWLKEGKPRQLWTDEHGRPVYPKLYISVQRMTENMKMSLIMLGFSDEI